MIIMVQCPFVHGLSLKHGSMKAVCPSPMYRCPVVPCCTIFHLFWTECWNNPYSLVYIPLQWKQYGTRVHLRASWYCTWFTRICRGVKKRCGTHSCCLVVCTVHAAASVHGRCGSCSRIGSTSIHQCSRVDVVTTKESTSEQYEIVTLTAYWDCNEKMMSGQRQLNQVATGSFHADSRLADHCRFHRFYLIRRHDTG